MTWAHVAFQCPFPSERPTAKLPHHHGLRSSVLPGNPLEKKSVEAPVAYYRLREFPARIRLWTSIANGHGAGMSAIGG